MIFGVAVVFPVVITFGVDSPGVAPGKAKRRPLCTGEQHSHPSGGNVASVYEQLVQSESRNTTANQWGDEPALVDSNRHPNNYAAKPHVYIKLSELDMGHF